MRRLIAYKKALEIMLKVFGEGHPSVATSYKCIIHVLEKMGDHKEAEEYKQKAKLLQ